MRICSYPRAVGGGGVIEMQNGLQSRGGMLAGCSLGGRVRAAEAEVATGSAFAGGGKDASAAVTVEHSTSRIVAENYRIILSQTKK